ncbi:MAG: hypothetical protein R2797_07620 [Gelidibacter sp.]
MSLLFFKQNFNIKKTNKILFSLISLDILFILLHILFIYLIFIRVQFNWSIGNDFMVNNDGSYPEIFQYIKFACISLILLYFVIKGKGIGYISWCVLYVLLLLDDSMQFHERFGTWVSEKFHYAPHLGLRAQDFGELTYDVLFGTFFIVFIAIGYYYGDKVYRKINIDLFLLFCFLLFFGVGVDMIDELFEDNRWSILFFNLFEDGGEMIALSTIVWYFCFLVIKPDNHDTYLHEYFFKRKTRKFKK